MPQRNKCKVLKLAGGKSDTQMQSSLRTQDGGVGISVLPGTGCEDVVQWAVTSNMAQCASLKAVLKYLTKHSLGFHLP